MSDPSAASHKTTTTTTTSNGFSRVFARIFGTADASSTCTSSSSTAGQRPLSVSAADSDREESCQRRNPDSSLVGGDEEDKVNGASSSGTASASAKSFGADAEEVQVLLRDGKVAATGPFKQSDLDVDHDRHNHYHDHDSIVMNENRMEEDNDNDDDDDSEDGPTHSMDKTHARNLLETRNTATTIEGKASEITINSKKDGIVDETQQREQDDVTNNPNSAHPEEEKEDDIDEEHEIQDLAQVLVELHEQKMASRSSVPSAARCHHRRRRRQHHHHRDGNTRTRRSKRRRRTSDASSYISATQDLHTEDPSVIWNLMHQEELADVDFHKRIQTATARSLLTDKTDKNDTEIPVVVWLTPHEQEQQIFRAATLVSRSLLQGMWPSPYRRWSTTTTNNNNNNMPDESTSNINNYPAHRAHMSMVGVSLEKFARDIIVPALVWRETEDNNNNNNTETIMEATTTTETTIEANANTESAVDSSTRIATAHDLRYPPSRRAFWGTLLLLRELLCQNAATIFGPQSSPPPSSPNNNNNNTKHHSDSDDETFFATQVLATAIILTGLASEPPNSDDADQDEMSNNYAKLYPDAAASSSRVDQLKKDFLELIERYDRGDAEFADGLAPLLLSPQPMPRKLAGEHEGVAWQIGCNWHRERHPLRSSSSSPRLADPTAVHMSILQFHGTLLPVMNGDGT